MPPARSLRSQAISPNRNTPRPSSPAFSETTNVSVLNFGPDGPSKIITRDHLKQSMQAYEDLLNKCATYRAALLTLSRATAGFADAMEVCSGLKGTNYESGTRLQAASGLHHLMSNHFHVMSETLDKQFEKPLRQHLENYRTIVHERSASYERALHERSSIIRETEMGNMKKKGRNLQTFREALAILQKQVDELDELKAAHYQEIVEHEEEVWDFVQGKVCLVVRSTMDVFDRLTAKASDPIIEPMLQSVPDPFDSYGPPPAEDQIFSILPPLSVMANAPSSSPSPLTSSTPELESSSDGLASGKNSWIPATGTYFSESSAAWADAAASPSSTSMPVSPARSVSPPAPSATFAFGTSASASTSSGRRHSHPAASPLTHQQRRSESKLRSVLSVIDETQNHPLPNGDPDDPSSDDSPAAGTASSSRNGTGRLNGSDMDPAAWGALKLKLAEHASSNGDDELTPRNSVLSRAQSPSSFSSDTPHAERSRSPRTDDGSVPLIT